jgi:hypothetical protein
MVTLRSPDPFGEALLIRSGEVSGKIPHIVFEGACAIG